MSYSIVIEKPSDKSTLLFAYVYRGPTNDVPPTKEFHTMRQGETARRHLLKKAGEWIISQEEQQ